MRIRSIADVAAAVRGRRLDGNLTQAELARRSGVSRKWISEFETGKATAEFALVIRVLEALGLNLDISEDRDTPGATSAMALSGPSASSSVDLDALLEEYRSQ